MVRLEIAVSISDENRWSLSSTSSVNMLLDVNVIKQILESFPLMVEGLVRSALVKYADVLKEADEKENKDD